MDWWVMPIRKNEWMGNRDIALMDAAEERGLLRLMMHAWGESDCDVPRDGDSMARLALMTPQQWKRGGERVTRAFDALRTGLLEDRAYKERIHQAQAAKGRAGGIRAAERRRAVVAQLPVQPAAGLQPSHQPGCSIPTPTTKPTTGLPTVSSSSTVQKEVSFQSVDDDDGKTPRTKAELAALIEHVYGAKPSRKTWERIEAELVSRGVPMEDYCAAIAPHVARNGLTNPEGFMLTFAREFRSRTQPTATTPAESPVLIGAQKYPCCGGTGKTAGGYCSCAVGETARGVDELQGESIGVDK
jgi:hypothetical protein